MNEPRWRDFVDDAGRVDIRYVFLVRSHARLQLVEARYMEIDEALNGLVLAMLDFIPQCACINETLARWERMPTPTVRQQRRAGA